MTPDDVTLVKNAIHNPAEPRHFMQIVPARGRQLASVDGHIVAESDAAVVVKEVGFDIYDPVIYFPRADVDTASLSPIDKTTHCPLKGDTEYFDVIAGGTTRKEAAWSYVRMVAGDELKNLIAFDRNKVSVDQAD